MALMLSVSASRVQAASIGELFGWLFGEEEGQDSQTGSGDSYSSQSGKEDSYNSQTGEGSTNNAQAADNSVGSDTDDYYMNLDVSEDGVYDTKDEVCAYLVQFHKLPSNYMTKKEARKK